MARLGRVGRQLRSLIWRARVEDEVKEELAFHLEMRVKEYIDKGLDPVAAREAALSRLGDWERVKARCERLAEGRDRKMSFLEYVAELRQDVRYAVRRLWKTPLFSGVAVVTLALGISGTTAIYSVVKAVVLSPFPYAHPERVMLVSESWNGRRGNVSPGNYVGWSEENAAFEQLAAFRFSSFNLADADMPERVLGARVTSNFFSVFGSGAAQGRLLMSHEDRPGFERVVVLSQALWSRRYGSDRGILGREIRLNGIPHTVVGVMPEGFDPTLSGEELWVPIAFPAEARADFDNHYLLVAGLRTAGMSAAQAQQDMDRVARLMAELAPEFNENREILIVSLPRLIIGDYRSQLYILLGAVFFILLIACANVANLLLAGGAARSKEIAVRAAVGAGRGRIMRQLLTESLVLSLVAAIVAVWLASIGVDFLVAKSPAGIPRLEEAAIDLGVLAFALAVAVTSSVAFGLIPSLRAARQNLDGAIRDGRMGWGMPSGKDRMRSGLIVAEVALAFTLLVGASLLVRSAIYLGGLSTGFDHAGIVTARLTLPRSAYEEREKVVGTFARVVELLGGSRGVVSAAVTSQAPLGPGGNENGLQPEGREDSDTDFLGRLRIVTPNYLEVMGIPLARGRSFTDADRAGAPRVMIVSESLARQIWPGEDPIGKRLRCCEGSEDDPRWKTVVGVARDIRSRGPTQGFFPEFYLPIDQAPAQAWDWIQRTVTVVARSETSTEVTAAALRAAVQSVDPTLPVHRIRTMEEELSGALARSRFNTLLLSLLGVIGLVLSAVGIYGVIAYFVSLRTSEMGLRMALGATAADLLRLLAWQGMLPVFVGLAAGLGLALAATRLLTASLYGVAPTDPMTYAAVLSIFTGVGLLAIYVPARRATRVNPTRALQST